MRSNLVSTIWTPNGSPAAKDMRFSGSHTSMPCTGLAISNYQPRLEGGLDRLEQEI